MAIKVLHVTNAFPYEGTPEYGVFVKEQIESLPVDKIESNILFINGRLEGKVAYIKTIFRLRREFKQYDVIHCHHVYSFLIALAAGVVGRRPTVLSFLNDWTHEVKDLRFQWLKKAICLLCARLATRVIFKSPIPPELSGYGKAVNLPNGVDSEFFRVIDRAEARSQLGLDPDGIYLLFVSSKNKFREQKRYDIFSSVLAHVQLRIPGRKCFEYAMVGQPRHIVPTIFSACDVHVLTSDYEGSPNSVKESLCCGTPVVCRDVGNVRDMLAGVLGATVLDTSDPEKIAAAVVDILHDVPHPQDVRASFLAKGLTKEIISERLASIYQEVSAGSAS